MTTPLERATALALDLARADVDPNEAQKALAVLRSRRNARAFFDYLNAVVKDGRAVIRSGRTLSYYRDLLAACERHLRGMQYQEMALALGWGVRLLRYYKAVPEGRKEAEAALRTPAPAPQQPGPRATERAPAPAVPAEEPQPARPAGPVLPAVGATFTGKVLKGDEAVFIIQVPGFSEREAIAVLAVEPGVPRYKIGKDSARVEVTATRTAKDGRRVLEVRRPVKA